MAVSLQIMRSFFAISFSHASRNLSRAVKGGTGKTTVTMFLATAMQKKGYKVAVLDSDPQQSAMRWSSASEEPLPFPTLPAPSPSELSESLHRAKKA
uniref:nucleotide-binding protein n=1 Tax=Helicobacter pylori TaxID=210 RepID=UPI0037C05413